MPHINIKLLAGRSEQQKQELADSISEALASTLGADDSSISVAIEDVPSGDWTEKVYKPEILGKLTSIYKRPGYKPF
ncbi:tautomerase family protein [Advenella mimigardefordensis]|uniref:tautomerase family protein n=1 Tax=Advenella mimigardefordensis TaxID=302406 RepID=UPI00046D1650